MADEQQQQKKSGGGETFGRFLTAQVGPFPVFVWGIIIIGGFGTAYFLPKILGSKSSNAANANTQSSTAPGSPDYSQLDPLTGVPYTIESQINPTTGLPNYYNTPPTTTPSPSPTPTPTPTPPPAPAPPPKVFVHPTPWPTQDSTLSGIARRYGVSLASIESFPENQYIAHRAGAGGLSGWNLIYTSDNIRVR